MTRDEFVDQKMAIEARMKQTRTDERRDISRVNEEYELRLRAQNEQHQRERRFLFDERDKAKEDVSEHYKNLRRQLYLQDQELVHRWRSQLWETAEENPDSGREGGAL